MLDGLGEGVLILLSSIIWLSVTCYKFGMITSDNILKHYIKKDAGRK